VESEFARVIIPVLVIGLLIAAGGTAMILLIMRAMAQGESGQKRQILLSIALLAFVFLFSAVFFVISFR
jgi:hypothetical protein